MSDLTFLEESLSLLSSSKSENILTKNVSNNSLDYRGFFDRQWSRVSFANSKKFKIKVIEGGYKPKDKIFKMKKLDFAKIKKGDKTIGQLEFAVSRFGNGQWEIQDEERHWF